MPKRKSSERDEASASMQLQVSRRMFCSFRRGFKFSNALFLINIVECRGEFVNSEAR